MAAFLAIFKSSLDIMRAPIIKEPFLADHLSGAGIFQPRVRNPGLRPAGIAAGASSLPGSGSTGFLPDPATN